MTMVNILKDERLGLDTYTTILSYIPVLSCTQIYIHQVLDLNPWSQSILQDLMV